MRSAHQKLRLQDFNSFDVERLLKEVIETLVEENQSIDNTLITVEEILQKDTLMYFLEENANNAAQIVRISSILLYKDDIYNFFSGGPLIRKEDVEI